MLSFITLAFTSVVAAQRILIGSPADDTTLTAGERFHLRVDKPVRCLSFLGCPLTSQNALTNSQELVLVVGLASCQDSVCLPPTDTLGTILYNGTWNPQYGEYFALPPHQNFTLTLPDSITGVARLNVGHFSLIGVSPMHMIMYAYFDRQALHRFWSLSTLL